METTLITTILSYVAMWCPALVSVLGIVAAVIIAIGKVRAAIEEFRSSTDIHDMRTELARLTTQNKELIRCNKLLLDRITKITNYADEVEKK